MVGNCPIVLAGLTNEDLIKLDSLVQSKIMDVKERFKQLGIGQDSFQEPLLPTSTVGGWKTPYSRSPISFVELSL
jgi:hypothetical protein